MSVCEVEKRSCGFHYCFGFSVSTRWCDVVRDVRIREDTMLLDLYCIPWLKDLTRLPWLEFWVPEVVRKKASDASIKKPDFHLKAVILSAPEKNGENRFFLTTNFWRVFGYQFGRLRSYAFRFVKLLKNFF